MINVRALTMSIAFPVLFPPFPLDRLRLVRLFFKKERSISLAAIPRIFLSSAVGGAARVLGARCGE